MGSLDNGTSVEPARSRRIAGWLVVVLAIDTLWQIARLHQIEPGVWLACDYAMRLTALAILAADPQVRAAVFCRERLKIPLAIVIAWALSLIPVLFALKIGGDIYSAYLPQFRIGFYPRPEGWLSLFDLTFGIALVALHEELVFRRALRLALAGLGDGKVICVASALLFGAFHWWSGVPNMVYATAFGIGAMVIYRGAGALWPVVVLHYLVDLWAFA